MSNINHLLNRFAKADSTERLLQAVAPPKARVFVEGLSGGQLSFSIAAAQLRRPAACQLFIAPKKEDAAYLFNDLTNLLDEQRVLFFPDSFKRAMFFDDLNNTQILQRSETVNKMTTARQQGQIVVTYPEALFEMVVSPKVLEENRLTVAVGERLDVDTMMEILVEFGFERTDFVYEPGQFSLRGGIVDLFSYGNELPYRIELFADEVETIRTFDPLTQLSSQKIESVSIIPNLNTRFRQDQKVSFFTVLPAETLIWVSDFQLLIESLNDCFAKADAFAQKISALDSAEIREIFRDRAFLFPGNVASDLVEHPLIFLSQNQSVLMKNFPVLFG